ncbi:Beta-1,3-glucanase [Andreprevotia lacus DSM 23236]|jgi:hypothetical protein|uniref:Beta-1,3-glucanase n=1 Tax=Andreprevotia lacus DSM 23236 TaxID=1121001 RepID=A0A1W1X8S9_9NEIS|nr:beta-1,3-glucanase family protein [Andreprevotia lacus]SMC20227.1 Beta-1,3-glucanase [Andreprevotia lacus DSM 23236]
MALTLQFSDLRGTSDTSTVSIGFVPGSNGDAFTITNLNGGAALQPLNAAAGTGNWYTLAELAQGVSISSFSGRVYVAYGTTWAVQGAGYEPAQAVTDPNFYLRYDKFEMTFTGAPADVANLTSIDYWSIPLTLQTSLNGNTVQTVVGLQGQTSAQEVFTALNALTTPPVSGLAGPGGVDGTPLPALVPGQFQQYGTGPVPGTAFARIIGPSSYPPVNPPPGAIPVTPYDLFNGYLGHLQATLGFGTDPNLLGPGLGDGVIALIAGNFAGVGPNAPSTGPTAPQQYSFKATIDVNLDITLTGKLSLSDDTVTIVYKNADLTNPSGIYGGNAAYYLNGVGPTNPGNDVYGWIGGDLFSGLNIGALGSSTPSNGPGSTAVGALPSQQWFTVSPSLFFAGLQPGASYYNQWAATLAPLSQAYNFAYSDRFAPVFASLNPANVDTLTLVLEPDSITQ